MVGLVIGVGIAGVLVCCAAVVLVLCARAPRAAEPAEHLSRLDRLDGLHEAARPAAHLALQESERVA